MNYNTITLKPLIGLSFLLIFSFFTSCSRDRTSNNCNYLLNAGVDVTINLNLPQFSQLQYVSNSVYVANQGNGGVIITNVGTGLRAWDASDPNHTPSSCSILAIEGTVGTCGCSDENAYNLFTGLPEDTTLTCTLKEYRVDDIGNNAYRVYN